MKIGEPLQVHDLAKRWRGTTALDSLSLTIAPARYTCVMGPSGSGKSTLLRTIAGLEHPDGGDIFIGSQSLRNTPPERRPFHMVFQDHALLPNLSVAQNVALAGQICGVAKSEREQRAMRLLEEVGLAPHRYGPRRPETLSGGERQRVALARALFDPPQFLLLDEPLSALDRSLRDDLRRRLMQLQRAHEIGFIHVTHDPEEALALADDLIVLAGGKVAAQGAPDHLYRHPPNAEVARLLGPLSVLPEGRLGDHERFIRPERLRPCAGGRLLVQEHRRACLGSVWEIELRHRERLILLHTMTPPADPVMGLDWDDSDVLVFPSS